eukprot:SM000151S01482  [mRNA]  locus=s151:1399:1851:- [translate_table: standard]
MPRSRPHLHTKLSNDTPSDIHVSSHLCILVSTDTNEPPTGYRTTSLVLGLTALVASVEFSAVCPLARASTSLKGPPTATGYAASPAGLSRTCILTDVRYGWYKKHAELSSDGCTSASVGRFLRAVPAAVVAAGLQRQHPQLPR